MVYCRTDLCPDCNIRLNLDFDNSTLLFDDGTPPVYSMSSDNYIIITTSGEPYVIKCENCGGLRTKQDIIDYWTPFLAASGTGGMAEPV